MRQIGFRFKLLFLAWVSFISIAPPLLAWAENQGTPGGRSFIIRDAGDVGRGGDTFSYGGGRNFRHLYVYSATQVP